MDKKGELKGERYNYKAMKYTENKILEEFLDWKTVEKENNGFLGKPQTD